jgi:prepilin-type N-terminal cleavage/methylation domain-containing protein
VRRLRAQRGLTLAELLLALAITAVIMVPLAAMFQAAANSGIAVRSALDLNSDARFSLDRIAVRAQTASMINDSKGTILQPGSAPAPALKYAIVDGDLVESEYATSTSTILSIITVILAPAPRRVSTIATNVTAFQLSAPATNGQPLLKIAMTLAANGSQVNASRTVRVGSAP